MPACANAILPRRRAGGGNGGAGKGIHPHCRERSRLGRLAGRPRSRRAAVPDRRSRAGPLPAFRVLHALNRHGDTRRHSGVGPAWEFNYGLVPNGQVHIIAPLAFDSPAGGRSQFGYGDTELGFKYRFIDEDKNGSRPMIGVYPLVELPTGNASLGLGAGNMRAYFPLWIQKSFGDWTTYGGGGYWINHGDDTLNRDYWFFGWLLQRQVTKQLAIGGEIFHQTATVVFGGIDSGAATTGFNIGAIYDFDEHNHLLASAGAGLQNASATNLFSWYIGYQITGP